MIILDPVHNNSKFHDVQQSGEKCGGILVEGGDGEALARAREKNRKSLQWRAKYGGGDNVVTSEPGRASAIVHMQQGI